MTFDRAVDYVMSDPIEGGYVNDPNDPGGETKYGISKRWHPDVDIKNLTKPQAKEIYRTEYWDKCKLNLLPNKLALMIFDTAVNSDPQTAIRLLQQALEIPVDGIIGAITLCAAHNAAPTTLLLQYASRRAFYYAGLPQVHRNPGWFTRLFTTYTLSLEP